MTVEAKNVSTRSDNEQPVSDDEIVADLFRLARTGRYHTAEPLMEEAGRMYPSEPSERIKACLKRLAGILWDNDHGGCATEYKRQRTTKRGSQLATAY
ncbi:hypothetical protein B382_19175 [Stutzerimonas stutzeri B1SMN1]|nr:hypothetical protein [Pseudomonas aeruginosa]EPL60696.1 hypothetical protein B382_19175 [Stutzerimonas stutzeri B1SMN1]HBO7920554.1 hypothetical protein [Pseudomonas aeruginosa]